MKKHYIDFTSNCVVISKEFQKAARNTQSEEYRILAKLRSDFPTMQVVLRAAPTRKRTSARLTYDKMVKYLSCQQNAPVLLNMFTNVREASKAQPNPYAYVQNWFLDVFPDYTAVPQFDKNGNILARDPIPMQAEVPVSNALSA